MAYSHDSFTRDQLETRERLDRNKRDIRHQREIRQVDRASQRDQEREIRVTLESLERWSYGLIQTNNIANKSQRELERARDSDREEIMSYLDNLITDRQTDRQTNGLTELFLKLLSRLTSAYLLKQN